MYLHKQKFTYSDLVLCLFQIRTNKTFFNRLCFKDLDIPFIEYRDQGSETIHCFFSYQTILNSKFKHRTNEPPYCQSLIDERSAYQNKKTLDFIGVDPDKTKNKLMIVSFLDTYCTIIEEKRKLNYETIHVKCHLWWSTLQRTSCRSKIWRRIWIQLVTTMISQNTKYFIKCRFIGTQ